MTRSLALLLVLVLLAPACSEPAEVGDEVPPPSREKIGPYPADRFYIDHDLFLPADEPKTIPAEMAGFLRPHDQVFGVEIRGHARAYPVRMISYHHVVNDVIEGIPVAVTY